MKPIDKIYIYHIVHYDKLNPIITDGELYCDERVNSGNLSGTTIGMSNIKKRRLNELTLSSHPGLYVGQCVPFYFCPRSVMLYLIWKRNHELSYKGGQSNIVHLVCNLKDAVKWAESNSLRWAFSTTNAGSCYFEDRNDLSKLTELNWNAINATEWKHCMDAKQAEFLIEKRFPWHLVKGIGVYNQKIYNKVNEILQQKDQDKTVRILPNWYY